MTLVFRADENYRSANRSPRASSKLCGVTFTSGEGRSSPPPPQVSVDQGKDVERSA